MRVGSLFSGVGGFDMGLEAAGFDVAWQVEIDPQARAVLRRHWPEAKLHEDVRNVGRSNLARVDLICGGFPCQDLSVAGRRAGLAGERSGLWHEFHRIVRELAPRWVLIENVPGLLSSNGGRDLSVVLGGLADLGYGWTFRVLDLQHFGVPQRRRRVFIVGRAGGFCPPEVLLEPESLPGDPAAGGEAGEDIADEPPVGTLNTRTSRSNGAQDAGVGHIVSALTTRAANPNRGDSAMASQLLAHTLRAEGFDASEDGTERPAGPYAASEPEFVVGAIPRRLTPVECERLMGWPDDHTAWGVDENGERVGMADGPRYRMCGNGVGKPHAEWIGRRIMEADAALRDSEAA